MTGLIETIYRDHRDGLYTLALSITGRAESAEDAVHDAVVRLCRAGARPAGDPVAYVFAAVRNAAIDVRRRATTAKAAVSIFDVVEPVADAQDVVGDRDRQRTIAAAVQLLADDQREAVVLHVYAGLTLQQAAEAAGVPLQTLASRYRRAVEKLKEYLAEMMNAE